MLRKTHHLKSVDLTRSDAEQKEGEIVPHPANWENMSGDQVFFANYCAKRDKKKAIR